MRFLMLVHACSQQPGKTKACHSGMCFAWYIEYFQQFFWPVPIPSIHLLILLSLVLQLANINFSIISLFGIVNKNVNFLLEKASFYLFIKMTKFWKLLVLFYIWNKVACRSMDFHIHFLFWHNQKVGLIKQYSRLIQPHWNYYCCCNSDSSTRYFPKELNLFAVTEVSAANSAKDVLVHSKIHFRNV